MFFVIPRLTGPFAVAVVMAVVVDVVTAAVAVF